MKLPRKIRERQRGQAMVEFMLSLMVIMIFVLFCFEMVMILWSYNLLADAAKEGVRFAIVNGSRSGSPSGPSTGNTSDCSTNVSAVQNTVTQFASLTFHDTSSMAVNVCYLDGNNAAPSRVQVTVSYVYKPYFDLPLTPTIFAGAEGRVVY
jgi:Flp pilus assembly protein TadG